MKCPYRPVTTTEKSTEKEITQTDFAECYGTECPWYCAESSWNNQLMPEMCQRVHTVHTMANNERNKMV